MFFVHISSCVLTETKYLKSLTFGRETWFSMIFSCLFAWNMYKLGLLWFQLNYLSNLTLRKIAIWLSKTWLFFFLNWQKLSFFFNKIAIGKKLSFFSTKLPVANYNFLSIFLKKMSSFWQFFDSQMAIFRRVSYWPTSTLVSWPA